MKFSILLGALLAFLSGTWAYYTQDLKDMQNEVLQLYEGLGTEDTHDFVRKDFPYGDSNYYSVSGVAKKFLTSFKEGFLNKDGSFNLYNYKNRHDTYRLFDVFYFAKDFDTFLKIAKWAKSELHPVQFMYAYTTALFHRKDTSGMLVPAFFEIMPSYFTPSDVMTKAYKSALRGVKSRKFFVNNTGYDYSWYKEQEPSYPQKHYHTYNEFDADSRLAYYREDSHLNDWYSKFFLQFAPFLSDFKYPNIEFVRRGEYMHGVMKFVLTKYNLERYGSGLPPVKPINFEQPIKVGYNSHLSDHQGRPFLARPDYLLPTNSNPEGVSFLNAVYPRYQWATKSGFLFSPENYTGISVSDIEGFNKLSKIIFGSGEPRIRGYYQPLYFQAMETLDLASKSANDISYTGTTLGNFMTELRDPAFYQILAYIDTIFTSYFGGKTPYTKEELAFPGVKITGFDNNRLETYFERYEYDISNGIPTNGPEDKYHYTVSQWRRNNKPFNLKLTIDSDKEIDAVVKIFFGPYWDQNKMPNNFAYFMKYVSGFDVFKVTLKPGTNTFDHGINHGFLAESESFKSIKSRMETTEEFDDMKAKILMHSFPINLMLPRGSKSGTKYQMMVVVHPMTGGAQGGKGWNTYAMSSSSRDHFFLFPSDRPAIKKNFDQPNIFFQDVVIYDVTEIKA